MRRFFVGVRDRNRDRADRVMLVRGATAVQALAIGLVKALHLFDQVVPHLLLVVFAHRLAPPRVSKVFHGQLHISAIAFRDVHQKAI